MRELLHRYVHARAGDKGDRLSLGVFVYEEAHYSWLVEQLSEANVAALFAHRDVHHVTRYLLPHLKGINLVLDDALQGGVNGALNLDGHGKTLSALLLSMEVTPPEAAP